MTDTFTHFSLVDEYQSLVSFPTLPCELWHTTPIVIELIRMKLQTERRRALTDSDSEIETLSIRTFQVVRSTQ